MIFAALAVVVTALSAAADAALCKVSAASINLLNSANTTSCSLESGYPFTSLVPPTNTQMDLMCSSAACHSMLRQWEELETSECTIGGFQLYADFITPVTNYCEANSSSYGNWSGSPTPESEGGDTLTQSSSSSNGSSESSSGMKTGTLVGIIGGSVGVVLVLIAIFLSRRKNRRSSHSTEDVNPPVDEERQQEADHSFAVLEAGYSSAGIEYRDIAKLSSKTHSTGDSLPDHTSNLWQDSTIIAARISIDRIKLGVLIGRGGFGEVYRGQYRDQTVAVKTLLPEKRKDLAQIQAFLSEIRLMATMEHPHIVQFIGVAWESLSDLYCVTEFMTGGDLRTLLNTYQVNGTSQGMDANKIEIVYQVAYALTYLHSLDPVVLHRDLKSRNILLSESLDAKVTDFGTSRTRSDETMTAGVGSWMWMAPEVMLGGHYDEKADVYSLGVVLSELDTHELPYAHAKKRGLSDAAMMQLLSMDKLSVHFSEFTDPAMVHFSESCVSLDPTERPTAAEVLYFFQKARNQG